MVKIRCLLLIGFVLAPSCEGSIEWFCKYVPIYFCTPIQGASQPAPAPYVPLPTGQIPLAPVAPTIPAPTPFRPSEVPPTAPRPTPLTRPTPGQCNSNPTSSTISSFDISFAYSNVPTDDRSLFRSAARRWQNVIIGDVPDVSRVYGTSRCGTWPATVDDLHICVAYENLDGPDGTLAFARPVLRRVSTGSPLTVTGEMVFDSSDVNTQGYADTIVCVCLSVCLSVSYVWECVFCVKKHIFSNSCSCF
jgi:hypothetical protein